MRLLSYLLIIFTIIGCSVIETKWSKWDIEDLNGNIIESNIGNCEILVNLQSCKLTVIYPGYVDEFRIEDYHLISYASTGELKTLKISCGYGIFLEIEFGVYAKISTSKISIIRFHN